MHESDYQSCQVDRPGMQGLQAVSKCACLSAQYALEPDFQYCMLQKMGTFRHSGARSTLELFCLQMPVGAAVENPDGEVLVGAPQSHPHSYVPPSHPSAAQNFHDSSARV